MSKNPLFNEFNMQPQNPQNTNVDLRQMYANAIRNPQEFVRQTAEKNPEFAKIVEMCKTQNPNQILNEVCKQRGIDLSAFMNAFR